MEYNEPKIEHEVFCDYLEEYEVFIERILKIQLWTNEQRVAFLAVLIYKNVNILNQILEKPLFSKFFQSIIENLNKEFNNDLSS